MKEKKLKVIRRSNGEINIIRKANPKEFAQIYKENMGALIGIASDHDRRILWQFIERLLPKDEGAIYLSTQVREDICRVTGLTNSNISRSLKRLLRDGWITKAERQHNYLICPEVAWIGHSAKREGAAKRFERYTLVMNYVNAEDFDKIDETTIEGLLGND